MRGSLSLKVVSDHNAATYRMACYHHILPAIFNLHCSAWGYQQRERERWRERDPTFKTMPPKFKDTLETKKIQLLSGYRWPMCVTSLLGTREISVEENYHRSLKCRFPGSNLRSSDQVGLGSNPESCIRLKNKIYPR